MSKLIGAAIFGQSGGPSSVINSSAAGVFIEALKHNDVITKVYGAAHGIKGILDEQFYDIGQEDMRELELLRNTPSSALGSVRYKLKAADVDDTDYKRLLEVFRKYNIRYFFYNGGNDSMDTCNKVSKYMQTSGYEMRVIGVPKTIDNDLFGTDHCPGYGSAAKYIATSIMELKLDATVYNTGMVCVLEVMGRNAGWLTAAAQLATYKGLGADLIYLPETPFDMDEFLASVKEVCAKNNNNFSTSFLKNMLLPLKKIEKNLTTSKYSLGRIGSFELYSVMKDLIGIDDENDYSDADYSLLDVIIDDEDDLLR